MKNRMRPRSFRALHGSFSLALALGACSSNADDGRDAGSSTGGATATGGSSTDGGASTGGNRISGAGGSSTDGTGTGGAGAGGAGGSGALPALTVWLAGDSTMASGSSPCPIGWGGKLQPLFQSTAKIVNSAVAGRSIRTWLFDVKTTMDSAGECELARDAQGQPTVQAHWQSMLDGMKGGDYLLIQFGINDGDTTCPRHVGAAAFQDSLGVMAAAAKARGAHPVFITPVSSISCNSSQHAVPTRGTYAAATKTATTKDDVPLIDLEGLSVALYDQLGFCPVPGGDVSASTTGAVGDFFCDDHTHFSATGAPQIAKLVADALRTQSLPLANYLR